MNNQEWWQDALDRLEMDERSTFLFIFAELAVDQLDPTVLKRLIAKAFSQTKDEVLT